MPVNQQRGRLARVRARATSGGSDLVDAVGALVASAVDRVLLRDEHVTSAADAKRLLTAEADTEALADKIQRVVVLAVPFVRMLVRGARLSRVPWAMVASSSVSIGITVRTGVRELQLLAALVAYRLEQATGTPPDPMLVEKVAIDLYLHPSRTPDVTDGKLHLVRLTRKWLLRGAFGRSTARRWSKALDAAEKLDAEQLAARWQSRVRR